ncbi:MAG TPA: HD domain-containing protein [Ktedonobacterales bacterium]|jgi:(p)ppGpp synthase/HD superfamily hydrolase
MPNLEDAIALAVEAHRGQKDKNGQPYILHPLRVMLRLESKRERIVGVLHDVVEDTPTTLDDLRTLGYMEDVVTAIEHMTRREDETYEQFTERAASNPTARRVKLADLEDNLDVRRLAKVTPQDAERFQRYLTARKHIRALIDAEDGPLPGE